MKVLAAAASALVAAAPVAAAEERRRDLVSFFTGRTHGEGDLRIALKKPVRHIVDSAGRRGANGEFLLVDRIKEGDDAVRERRWAMRPSGTNAFTGTMTDAVGPVHVTMSGSKATIRYKMRGGISIDQQLALQADGKTQTLVQL